MTTNARRGCIGLVLVYPALHDAHFHEQLLAYRSPGSEPCLQVGPSGRQRGTSREEGTQAFAGRAAGCAVLPPGVHAAARAQRAGRGARALGLRHADAVHGGHAQRVRRQPALAGRHRCLHAGAAHVDAGPATPLARACVDGLRGARPRTTATGSNPSAHATSCSRCRRCRGCSGASSCRRWRKPATPPRCHATRPTRHWRARSACSSLRRHDWVVYAKTPLAGPAAVLDYLARYTHRTAIGNERLVAIAGDKVLLRVRADDTGSKRTVAMDGQQFVGRLAAACAATGLQAHPPLRPAGAGGQDRAAGHCAQAAGHASSQPAGTRGRAGLHAPRGGHRDRVLPALQARPLARRRATQRRPRGHCRAHARRVPRTTVTHARRPTRACMAWSHTRARAFVRQPQRIGAPGGPPAPLHRCRGAFVADLRPRPQPDIRCAAPRHCPPQRLKLTLPTPPLRRRFSPTRFI